MTKVSFIIDEENNSSWAEITNEDGVTKRWNEVLTIEERATIAASGMVLQKGTAFSVMFESTFTDQKYAKLIVRLEKAINKANDILKEIVTLPKVRQ